MTWRHSPAGLRGLLGAAHRMLAKVRCIARSVAEAGFSRGIHPKCAARACIVRMRSQGAARGTSRPAPRHAKHRHIDAPRLKGRFGRGVMRHPVLAPFLSSLVVPDQLIDKSLPQTLRPITTWQGSSRSASNAAFDANAAKTVRPSNCLPCSSCAHAIAPATSRKCT